MNRLNTEKLVRVVSTLVEGVSNCIDCDMKTVSRVTDPKRIGTSFVERQTLITLTLMSMRRFTQHTKGFSKNIENHGHTPTLYFQHYNFVRVHKTLRVTLLWRPGSPIMCGPWKN